MSQSNSVFKEKSLIAVLALCVFSFGLYVIFRLWQLTNILNSKTENPISKVFTTITISIHLVSLLGLIYHFLFPAPATLLLTAKLLHLLSTIFHIIWIIKVRNRINTINNVSKGNMLWLDPILSSFFHVIYFQHKINQSIASETEAKIAI
jgi:hypothetical protein